MESCRVASSENIQYWETRISQRVTLMTHALSFLIAGRNPYSFPGRSQDYVVSLTLRDSPPQGGVSLVTNGVRRAIVSRHYQPQNRRAVSSLCFPFRSFDVLRGCNGAPSFQFKIQNSSLRPQRRSARTAQSTVYLRPEVYLYDYFGSGFDLGHEPGIREYDYPVSAGARCPETPLGPHIFPDLRVPCH